MPDAAVERGAAGRAAQVERDAGRGALRRIVPANGPGVGDGGAERQRRIELDAKAQFGAVAGLQIAVSGRVVGAQDGTVIADSRSGAIEKARPGDIGCQSGQGRQIVDDNDVRGWNAADVGSAHTVFEPVSGFGLPAPDDRHVLGDRHHLRVADDHVGGLVAVGGIAVGVGRLVRHLVGGHGSLVADQGAARHSVVDPDVEGDEDCGADRNDPRPRLVGRVNFQTVDQRRHAAVRTERLSVETQRIGHVGRILRHGIGKDDARGICISEVVDLDGVPQHVTRIDDSRRTVIALNCNRLLGAQGRQVAHHVAGRIEQGRRRRVVGGRLRQRAAAFAGGCEESLIFDEHAVHDGRIDHDVESHGGDIAAACRQVTGRSVHRRVDGHAVGQRAGAWARIGHGGAVQGGAAGHVGGIGGDVVPKHGVDSVLAAGVLDGERVAQGIAGHQFGWIAGEVRGSLPDLESRLRRNQGGGLVAGRRGQGVAAQQRPVENACTAFDDGRQRRLEYDCQRIARIPLRRQFQVADIDKARPAGAAL